VVEALRRKSSAQKFIAFSISSLEFKFVNIMILLFARLGASFLIVESVSKPSIDGIIISKKMTSGI
jgi:hypothetical protein